MQGNVYRSGRRRTVSCRGVVAGIALGLAVLGGSVSSAYAKPPAAKAPTAKAPPEQPHAPAVSHKPAVPLPTKAHAAGHKIA
jgi:hypothetical protein